MNVSLSIYDVFANAIPGSLYLAASVYLGIRFGWIEPADLAGIDTTFAIVAAAIASYLLGHVPGSGLRWLVERGNLWGRSTADVRAEFRRRNPAAASRPFVDADPFTLLAGLRQASPEAAVEVDRSRASGIMLRSTCPAFLLGAGIALVEAAASADAAPLTVGIALLVLAGLSLYEGQKRSTWARIHTYECAVWMPDVDARLAGAGAGPGTEAASAASDPP